MLQQFKNKEEFIEYLENNPINVNKFIDQFIKDLSWLENQDNYYLNREVIRITLENPEIENTTILKLLVVLEDSSHFKNLFIEELKNYPALFQNCMNSLKTNESWMQAHPSAVVEIMKGLGMEPHATYLKREMRTYPSILMA